MDIKAAFYKICIVGDFGVGKSTLLHQYLERRFIPNVQSTIASNFFVKHLKIPNVRNVITLQIWDLAGQDHFKWVRQAFYKGAKGIAFVFDLSRKETFEQLASWIKEVEDTIGNVPRILVGNKLDLVNPHKRAISKINCLTYKQKINACSYVETSAKLGTGVDNIFYKLTFEMNKKFKS
ncbi:MAG: Rab family GTPase [Candidatus Thorarchaeota archaeon]